MNYDAKETFLKMSYAVNGLNLDKSDRHELKQLPIYFKAVLYDKKTFEVRKNDRDFKVSDVMVLKEWDIDNGYTGNEIYCVITYILNDPEYCKEDMVIIGFNKLFKSRGV